MVTITAPHERLRCVRPHKLPQDLVGVGRRVGVRERRGGPLAVRDARPRVAVILEPRRVPHGVFTHALQQRPRARPIRPNTVRASVVRRAGLGALVGARAGGALPLITNFAISKCYVSSRS